MMKHLGVGVLHRVLSLTAGLLLAANALAQPDPLPSWNDGAAKTAIIAFVKDTTTQGSPQFVPRQSPGTQPLRRHQPPAAACGADAARHGASSLSLVIAIAGRGRDGCHRTSGAFRRRGTSRRDLDGRCIRSAASPWIALAPARPYGP